MTHGYSRHGLSMADHQCSICRQFIGSLVSDIAITAQEVDGAASGIKQQTAMHRLERMKAELKRGHDAEVTASATNGPEQVFILRRTHRQVCPVGADQVGRDPVVAAQSKLAHQPAETAAEGQTANSRG